MELIGTIFFLLSVLLVLFLYKGFGILRAPHKKKTRVHLKLGNPFAQDCRRCGGSFLRSRQNLPYDAADDFCGFCENVATKIMKTELKEIKDDEPKT